MLLTHLGESVGVKTAFIVVGNPSVIHLLVIHQSEFWPPGSVPRPQEDAAPHRSGLGRNKAKRSREDGLGDTTKLLR